MAQPAANLTCTEIFYPTRCRPLRLIHSIFLRNFRMKPEPPEIAQVSTQLNQSQSAQGRHLGRVAAYLADERRSTCRIIKANRKPKRPLRRT